MKTRLNTSMVLMAALLLSGAAQAEGVDPILNSGDKVISSREVVLPIDISEKMVKHSRADYSMPTVKILVPELAAETIMNHRNTAEGAPCLAAYDAKTPSAVIQGRPARETAVFKIELVRSVYPNLENKTCEVVLTENVTTTIRGFVFEHSRNSILPTRHLDDCK
ncbi:MAG: hypothetical protein V4692_10050 [Bdellovibrionota bacterium]